MRKLTGNSVPRHLQLSIVSTKVYTRAMVPHGWNLNSRKQINDWEVIRVVEFFNTFGTLQCSTQADDNKTSSHPTGLENTFGKA